MYLMHTLRIFVLTNRLANYQYDTSLVSLLIYQQPYNVLVEEKKSILWFLSFDLITFISLLEC